MDIDQRILGFKMILGNQIPDHRNQKRKVLTGKRQMPCPVIQATDMGLRPEQSARIVPDHFIQAVAEQKPPVIRTNANIVFWHEPAVKICNHMSPHQNANTIL
jgi:hypothetical protein